MTKANRELLERKKNIIRHVSQYETFDSIPRDVLNNVKFTYNVSTDYVKTLFVSYKRGEILL
jgi:hypothetical protein